jgi:hypothetical protein
VPEVFDHGRLGPAILFSAPQIGAYVTVVLIVPRASPGMLRTIAILALGTAVYGAALALVQRSARRACGYLFVSQSALVMAGLDCSSTGALAGGLLLWLSAGLAFAGLGRAVLVLEARRGRLDLTTYHGGYERMPVLAITFLAMGLACTGFPGTLGFVGQELLVDGAVDAFPVMGFAVVVAAALTGLAVLRMYFSLFCGRHEASAHSGLRFGLMRRESWTFVALVAALVGFGIAPRALVDSRFAASEEILRLRRMHVAEERMQPLASPREPLAAQMKWHAGDDHVRLEEKRPLDQQRPLIVKEVLPPLRGHELRQDDRQEIAPPFCLELFDVFEQRLQQRTVRRIHHDQRHALPPFAPVRTEALGRAWFDVDVERSNIRRQQAGILNRFRDGPVHAANGNQNRVPAPHRRRRPALE